MDAEVLAFLARHPPQTRATRTWVRSAITLEISAAIGDEPPPLAYVTSVRCVVVRQGQVLVVQDPESYHILPGGRREPGETLEQTLRREVLEETGWTLGEPRPLGFIHFHHLTPRPPAYPYPYPDFFQIVYLADAIDYVSSAVQLGEYELGSDFYPPAAAATLGLSEGERLFLTTALARLAAGGEPRLTRRGSAPPPSH